MLLESHFELRPQSKFNGKTPRWGQLLDLAYCISANIPDQHELSAFAEVLNSAEKPILVGGQAVNVWAEHYASAIPALDPLRPFMSKDADIVGDRAMAERIAAATHWQLTCYHEPRTIAIGMLSKELPNKESLLVEVISSVHGLTPKDLSDPDLVELRPGNIYRVPSPIILLKAKLANVAHLLTRHDGRTFATCRC